MNYPVAGYNQAIVYAPADVSFPEYDSLLLRAMEIADYINDIELTEDNVKEVKETLARARKVTDGLNRARIDLKKAVMGNFYQTEVQIKHIIDIVDVADTTLRNKVSELEETERLAKKEMIRQTWDKRINMYTFQNIIENSFERWLQQRFLNKSTTMKSIEADMVAWMEQREKDIAALKNIGDDYLVAYLDCLDMTEAVNVANKRRVDMALISSVESNEAVEESAIFIITGKKNIKMAEMLLNENDIKFERK